MISSRRPTATYGAVDLTATGPMPSIPNRLGSTPSELRPRILGGRDTGGVVAPASIGQLQGSTLSSTSITTPAGADGSAAGGADGGCCG